MALRNSKGILAINGVVSALCYDLSTNNRERHRCGDVGALGIVAPEEGVSEATDKIRAEPTTSISKLNLWSQRVIASPSDFIVVDKDELPNSRRPPSCSRRHDHTY
ncbi:uncharacterized protein CLUP02_13843 [Colletotrichum lupini]|uniref:Uncharacterized protein n=1 Tax=Colletotrichum lupini TaxID=145971 RepID=A0A9Q8T3F9_9PEZI|nr:uncharacterized protein CLUP02_13843 [Colletotrichum lupini]UQC88320.1 hypothetical protein CLUP02_13843 [Colletotrichum lupini]